MALLEIKCVSGRLRMDNRCAPKVRRDYDTGVLFSYPDKEVFIHRNFIFYTEGQRFFVSDSYGNKFNFLPSHAKLTFDEVLQKLTRCQSPYADVVTDDTLIGKGDEDSPLGVDKDKFIEPGDDVSELNNDAGYLTLDTLPDINDGELDITTGDGLEGSGKFTANQAGDTVIEIAIDKVTIDKINHGETAFGWGDHSVEGYLKADDITGKEDKVNKVTDLDNPNNTTYPTTKAVNDAIQDVDSGIVQSDWKENDSSDRAFIRNKPTKVSDFNIDINTDDISEGNNNLYYTESRVANNSDVSANSAARHTHNNKGALDKVTDSGSGDKYLANDGTYNTVIIPGDDVTNLNLNIDTDDIDEGSNNKYYTENRVEGVIDNKVTKNYIDNLGIDAVTLNGKDNYILDTEKGSPGGVATLNSSGKLSTSQVPAIALTETFEVNDINERDALPTGTGEGAVGIGDVVIVSDASDDPEVDEGGATYIYTGSEYKRLVTPTDDVTSVNGQNGIVVLDTDDISEGSTNKYFTNARVSNNSDVSANTNARHTHSNKSALDNIINSGNGKNALMNDGTYKSVVRPGDDVTDLNLNITSDDIPEGDNKYFTEQRVCNTPCVQSLIADQHTHPNKALLDTYDQSNEDIEDAVIHKDRKDNPHEVSADQVIDLQSFITLQTFYNTKGYCCLYQKFRYTGGDQIFEIDYDIFEITDVFVNGEKTLDFTFRYNEVEILGSLNQDDIIEVKYTHYCTFDKVYGIRRDKNIASPDWERIGKDMTLHASLPVQSQLKRCIVNNDGEIVYYLHDDDSTKKADGTDAVLDGTDGQYMRITPRHFQRFDEIDGIQYAWISTDPFPGSFMMEEMYASPAEGTVHRPTNTLSSVVSMDPDYRGGNNNASLDGDPNSQLGMPATAISRTNFVNYAENRGEAWTSGEYEWIRTEVWLRTIEYATNHHQRAIDTELTPEGYRQGGLGDGPTTINSTEWLNFNGRYPIIPIGATLELGNHSGEIEYVLNDFPEEGEARSIMVNSYRGIQNPYGHIYEWMNGVNFRATEEGTKREIFKAVGDAYSTNSYDGYRKIGDMPPANGYITEILFGPEGDIFPVKASGGSATTYFTDYYYRSDLDRLCVLAVSGLADYGAPAGSFFARTHYAPSSTFAVCGSRLCFFKNRKSV